MFLHQLKKKRTTNSKGTETWIRTFLTREGQGGCIPFWWKITPVHPTCSTLLSFQVRLNAMKNYYSTFAKFYVVTWTALVRWRGFSSHSFVVSVALQCSLLYFLYSSFRGYLFHFLTRWFSVRSHLVLPFSCSLYPLLQRPHWGQQPLQRKQHVTKWTCANETH